MWNPAGSSPPSSSDFSSPSTASWCLFWFQWSWITSACDLPSASLSWKVFKEQRCWVRASSVPGTCWRVLGMDVRNSRRGWTCTKPRWVLQPACGTSWSLLGPCGWQLSELVWPLLQDIFHCHLHWVFYQEAPQLTYVFRESTFFLFLLNLVLNNLRSLPDLLPLSYLSGVFCLFPLSVLSHRHLDLFSRHSLPGFGAHRSTSADFSSAALTCTSKATVLRPLQSEQMLGFVWVYVAVSRSSEVQAGAKLLLAHVPGVLRLPTRRGGAWFLGWAKRSTNSADSHQMFTETVHKIYVCFTALGLQWSLFPYFRKSLNLAGKTWWTSAEGLSIPGETNFFQLIIIVIFFQGLNISMYAKVDGMKLYISCDLLSPEYWGVAIPHLKSSKAGIYFVG